MAEWARGYDGVGGRVWRSGSAGVTEGGLLAALED